MRSFVVKQASCIKGKITPPGDKSIAHRAIIISAIGRGKTTIKNFPISKDCFYTKTAFKRLGVRILQDKLNTVTVFGKGLYGLKRPKGPILIGDSGTTLRLLLGVLAGQGFAVTLKAGKSLSERPMLRVTRPLRLMGAKINARLVTRNARREEYPPITIRGGGLKAITYRIPVASAQVKSAILLAGLYAKGKTKVLEPVKTRDHTERMLTLFKAGIRVEPGRIIIDGAKELLSPKTITVAGDISSAGFFMVLAALLPNSQILIKNISLNPSRTGIIKVLKRMGADIKVTSYELRVTSYEPMGDLIVKSSRLKGTVIKSKEIPSLIDELPILMVAACFARGKTVFESVQELRVKETDRVNSMSVNLIEMGANIEIIKRSGSEKIIIRGTGSLRGAKVKSFRDHRTAMSMIVAGLKASGMTFIDDTDCINKSFPGFLDLLKKLIK